MKNTIYKILFGLLFLPALLIARGASLPALDITVMNATGKVVYKGTTGASGAFATDGVPPGNYVVEFDSKGTKAKGAKFALSVTAGKNTVSSDSVAGEKFVDPGIAMRVAVGANSKITGQVAPAAALAKQTQAVAGGKSAKWDGPVKIINGKRYIWARPQTSSVSGGHWVEEGSVEAAQVNTRVLPGSQPTQNTGGMKY